MKILEPSCQLKTKKSSGILTELVLNLCINLGRNDISVILKNNSKTLSIFFFGVCFAFTHHVSNFPTYKSCTYFDKFVPKYFAFLYNCKW